MCSKWLDLHLRGGRRVFPTVSAPLVVVFSRMNTDTNLVGVRKVCVGTDRGAYSRAWAGRFGAAQTGR